VNDAAYTLLGMTAVVAGLVGVAVFALLKFLSASREARGKARPKDAEQALLSSALQEAVLKLKAQERATAARADASERLSEEIISSLTAGLLVVGRSSDIRILNPAGRRLLGVGEDDLPQDWRQLIPGSALAALIDECLSSGLAIVRRTVHMPERQGGARFGVTVSPLYDESRELHGAVCLFTDLTTVQQLEEQLRLKESLATVGELTAGIAHEFRNGLATIHGYSKLLDLKSLPEGYRPYVEGIRAEAESLGQIVTNFLNFAKPAQLSLSDVELRAICERAADEVRAEARTLGGDIEVRGEFGRLQGDEVLLRQAFSNLLRNAVEACRNASVTPHVVVESSLDERRATSSIVVDDNGPGIDADARERIFQPFFTSKRDGTGLGLALVQKIIVFHNGRVVAGVSPAGGASLQVTLPLS
jgi:signal transduction histidine kinase